jgi:hypothetical protein
VLSIISTVSFMAVMAVCIFSSRHVVGYIFSSDPQVVETVAMIAPFAALFQVRILTSSAMPLGFQATLLVPSNAIIPCTTRQHHSMHHQATFSPSFFRCQTGCWGPAKVSFAAVAARSL